MKKILLIIYKIEKNIGSEDGSGYNIAHHIVKMGYDITIISRVNNIKKLRHDANFNGVKLIGLDVPRPWSFIKRKGRGVIPYYYAWQYFVGRRVRQLQRHYNYDVIHQLNFHTDWAAHFLNNSNGKMVWGPIMHHPHLPNDYVVGKSSRGDRMVEWLVRETKYMFWTFDPFLRRAIRRTNTIFYGNRDIAPPFQSARDKIIFQAHAGADGPHTLPNKPMDGEFNVLFVGRFIQLKGVGLALTAFHRFIKNGRQPNAHLTMIGRGPMREFIEHYIARHDLDRYITINDWIAQDALNTYYAAAHAFLFPSLEAQGLVVSESMAHGAIPIVLEDSGPAFVAQEGAVSVFKGQYDETADELNGALISLYDTYIHDKDAYRAMMRRAYDRYQNHLTWPHITSNITAVYDE